MAASWTGSRSPTSVITQRLWSTSISRSRRKTPSTFMASTIASTFALSRPSEKLGTHSTKVAIREKNITADSRLLPGNEILHHRLAHQVWRQQPLCQNEIVELLLVEFRAQSRFCLFAQCDQFGVAVEITVRLTRSAVRVALHFLLGEGVGLDYVLFQNPEDVGRLGFARLQLRIKKRP